jgi:hypothetical protein
VAGGRCSRTTAPDVVKRSQLLSWAAPGPGEVLVRASLRVVLQFLAWLVGYVRRPRRVWVEWSGEGWREIP